ncbi:MAG: nucleotidyltransferase family protein [Cyanobacteria bacterium P01_A01_bin.84]
MTNVSLINIGLIILAAGSASRMGKPKQLLTYQGNSLISHIVKVGINSICEPVIVVLGAYAEQIKSQIDKLPIQIIENLDWETGMSSSIRAGVNAINHSHPQLDAVIIALADQPLISETAFNQLVQTYQTTENTIIASAYGDVIGVPALFHRTFFPELINLGGDRGAKFLIGKDKNKDKVLSLSIPAAAIDIDTPEDYENLLSIYSTPN